MKDSTWFKVNGYSQCNIIGFGFSCFFLGRAISENYILGIIVDTLLLCMNVFVIWLILNDRHDDLKLSKLEKEAFT